jgi:hypothetical protein
LKHLFFLSEKGTEQREEKSEGLGDKRKEGEEENIKRLKTEIQTGK